MGGTRVRTGSGARVALAGSLMLGLLVGASAREAGAHGIRCRAIARQPEHERDLVTARGRYNCGRSHAQMIIRVCLQKRTKAGWVTRGCRRFESNGRAISVLAETAQPCSRGVWRTRTRGRAENMAGETKHSRRTFSESIRIRRC